jgi:hypothetical protein
MTTKHTAQTYIDAISHCLDLGLNAEACFAFHSIDDDEIYEAVIEVFPGLRNYGPRGEWIGSVANENGWTP